MTVKAKICRFGISFRPTDNCLKIYDKNRILKKGLTKKIACWFPSGTIQYLVNDLTDTDKNEICELINREKWMLLEPEKYLNSVQYCYKMDNL